MIDRRTTNNQLVYGIGVNDSDYLVTPKDSGKQIWCPYYKAWKNILERCYSNRRKSGREVCEEWTQSFMAFRFWMESQDWMGKELDKDLVGNSRLYSPNTCVFISHALNSFINGGKRGIHKIGVYKRGNRFKASVSVNCETIHLGAFKTEAEANLAWVAAKTELAERFIANESDPRIIRGIRNYIERIQPKKEVEHDFESQAQLV